MLEGRAVGNAVVLRDLAHLVRGERGKELSVTILPPPPEGVHPVNEHRSCYDLKRWLGVSNRMQLQRLANELGLVDAPSS